MHESHCDCHGDCCHCYTFLFSLIIVYVVFSSLFYISIGILYIFYCLPMDHVSEHNKIGLIGITFSTIFGENFVLTAGYLAT